MSRSTSSFARSSLPRWSFARAGESWRDWVMDSAYVTSLDVERPHSPSLDLTPKMRAKKVHKPRLGGGGVSRR